MVEVFFLFLEIMLINIVLSGDNALVIAMASNKLPFEERKKAMWWGVFGAVGLRIVLTVVAVVLLKVPYIKAAGSLLLMYIAFKLLFDEESYSQVREPSSIFSAVRTIIIADFVMSLDNVLAIAAIAKENYILIVLGIGLSIPLIVWGSTLIMKLLHRYPVLIYIGAGILGYTAGEMFVSDIKVEKLLEHLNPISDWLIPIITTMIVIDAGLLKKLTFSKVK